MLYIYFAFEVPQMAIFIYFISIKYFSLTSIVTIKPWVRGIPCQVLDIVERKFFYTLFLTVGNGPSNFKIPR